MERRKCIYFNNKENKCTAFSDGNCNNHNCMYKEIEREKEKRRVTCYSW